MGDKIKPNWGREASNFKFIPSLSEDFKSELSLIVNLPEATLKRLINKLDNISDIYICRKSEKNERPKLTPKKRLQAALEIKQASQNLSRMLYGNAGGVKSHIDASIHCALSEPKPYFFLKELRQVLNSVEEGCNDCIKDINLDSNSTAPRPKELVALEVKLAYEEVLQKKASTTLNVNGLGTSEYAQILKMLLTEIDNFAPSNGDLKKIMSWAKNNKDFYLEN